MLRNEALERQRLLFNNRCMKCPYRGAYHYTKQCMSCPVRDELLEIGQVLDKTIRSAG
ncbi:hypothetical protein [Rummeliibacillus pycnus]|uniref:hypothetical protein n=1 Tax=Rummeliibacillus pycnus TaxID=101070 RepID=UPI0037CC5C3E